MLRIKFMGTTCESISAEENKAKCVMLPDLRVEIFVIVGLRPALEGFVVTMHEGACETGSQIPTA